MSDVIRLPFAYCYRCPIKKSYPECGIECLEFIERAFVTYISADDTAAIITEPIQGEGGFIIPPKDYLQEMRKIAEENNVLFIADEVQTGFGRTGKTFCIENYEIIPDLMTVAKAFGGGFPLSGVIGKSEIMDAPEIGGIGGTYGGNPISCVAALAAIEILQEKRLADRARQIEKITMERFEEFKEKYVIVGDVRGMGAMNAIELVKDRERKTPEKVKTGEIIRECINNGLLILKAGIYGNVIRLLPPLTIEEEILIQGLDILEGAIKKFN
jgi:4-aminobutyrate aminotransferase/(S)-3-amino-2-methylpropionate transaminase